MWQWWSVFLAGGDAKDRLIDSDNSSDKLDNSKFSHIQRMYNDVLQQKAVHEEKVHELRYLTPLG